MLQLRVEPRICSRSEARLDEKADARLLTENHDSGARVLIRVDAQLPGVLIVNSLGNDKQPGTRCTLFGPDEV